MHETVDYIINLVEQGKSTEEASEHARLMFGLTQTALDELVRQERARAFDVLAYTDSCPAAEDE